MADYLFSLEALTPGDYKATIVILADGRKEIAVVTKTQPDCKIPSIQAPFVISHCPLHELPEHGEWIEDRMDYRCSVCGKTVKDEIIYMLEPYQLPAFCPYCGVKLEPPKEETE